MSDDGYCDDDDEYDEFDGDLFWNDDGEMMLADNLAEHSLPSPIYAEDPTTEILNGYSDWEYYSDDYYDDDPSILTNNPQSGSPVRKRKSMEGNGLQRGKKRKLAATSDIPVISLDDNARDNLRDTMKPSFKGTVWAVSISETNEKSLYEPGMGDRVALLGNWRDVFRTSHRPSGEKRQEAPSLSYPESGQKPVTPTTLPSHAKKAILGPEADGNEQDDSIEGLQPEEDEVELWGNPKRQRVSYLTKGSHPPKQKIVVEIPLQRAPDTLRNGRQSEKESEPNPLSSRKRKADRTGDEEKIRAPKPPPSLQPSRKRKSDDVEDNEPNEETSRPRAAKRLASSKLHSRTIKRENHTEDGKEKTTPTKPPPPPPPSSRKRKATDTPDDDYAHAKETTSTCKPRAAKRVASAKAKSIPSRTTKEKEKEKAPLPLPTARTTRSRKK